MSWEWAWIPGDPPGHFGDNLVFDLVRLLVVLLAILLVFTCGRVLLEQRRRAQPFRLGQVMRFIALGLGLWYVALTEMAVFGTSATPRLIVGLAMALTGLHGVHDMRVEQRANPVVRR